MDSLLDAVTMVSGESAVRPTTNGSSPSKKKAKKSKGDDIVWNEARCLALLSSIMKNKAHKKSDETLHTKMRAVVKDLKTQHLFSDLDKEAFEHVDAFDTKWKRIKKNVQKKFALDSEGANLSGLDEDNVSEVEKLAISLIEDEMKTKADVVAAKEAMMRKNNSMLSFESNILKKTIHANPKEARTDPEQNDENTTPSSAFFNSSVSSLSSLGVGAATTTGVGSLNEQDFLMYAQKEREAYRLNKIKVEEDKMKIEEEKVKLERMKLEIEDRKILLQERQSNQMQQLLTVLLQKIHKED